MAVSSVVNTPVGDQPWRWMRRGVNLGKRPVTVNMSASLFKVLLIILIGVLWTGFALNIVRDVGFETDLNTAFTLTLPGIGVVIVLVALFKRFRRRRVTFDESGVSVADRGIKGGESWSLPYRAFEGVYMREQTVRKENGATTYQIIELLHADPEKTIPLYVKATHDIPTAKWEEYARTLYLPAITESRGRMVVRRPEELSQSHQDDRLEPSIAPIQSAPAPQPMPVQPVAAPQPAPVQAAPAAQYVQPPAAPTPVQAAADARPTPMATQAGNSARPAPARNAADASPKGISISADTLAGDPVLNVVIKVPRYPYWLAALGLGFPLMMIGTGLFGQDLSSLAAFGLAFLLLAGLVFVPDWRSTREIDITRSYLTFTDNMGRGGGNSETIPVKEVENITIQRARSKLGNELLIAHAGEEYQFGIGLSKDGLAWLHSYLAAAIANA